MAAALTGVNMTEDETLGKLAYQTYYSALGLSPELWDTEPLEIRQTWIDVAKAVATHVLAEVQVAEQASE